MRRLTLGLWAGLAGCGGTSTPASTCPGTLGIVGPRVTVGQYGTCSATRADDLLQIVGSNPDAATSLQLFVPTVSGTWSCGQQLTTVFWSDPEILDARDQPVQFWAGQDATGRVGSCSITTNLSDTHVSVTGTATLVDAVNPNDLAQVQLDGSFDTGP